MIFSGNKMDVVQFVTALQLRFGKDSQLTTVTRQDRLGVCFVSTVTDTSSEGIVKELAQTYSLRLIDILPPRIQTGLSRVK